MNLSSLNPASQYQTLKRIQGTVGTSSTLYQRDLASLAVFQPPQLDTKVNWNQMSDRAIRHFQPSTVAGGSTYHGSSTKSTITGSRPGAQCPGGTGVDIKHNSYARYLLRLQGKGPARRGIIPPSFGQPIVFNPAFPIYGGKTIKTNIVSGCNCVQLNSKEEDSLAFAIVLASPRIYNQHFAFDVGTTVYALDEMTKQYEKGTIIEVLANDTYEVLLATDEFIIKPGSELLLYFPCSCALETEGIVALEGSSVVSSCYILNQYSGASAVAAFADSMRLYGNY